MVLFFFCYLLQDEANSTPFNFVQIDGRLTITNKYM